MLQVVLLAAAVLAAPAALTTPDDPARAVVRQASVRCVIQESADTDRPGARGTVSYSTTTDHAAAARPQGAERPGAEPAAEPDWGEDKLVRGGSTFPGDFGRLSIDHADNGDLYAGVLNLAHAPLDTFWVYRSTDNGATWATWRVCVNEAGDDTIIDGKVIVGPGDNPWVYMFVHYSTAAGAFACRRMRADQSADEWIVIASGDTVRTFDVDRNIEDPPALFLACKSGVDFRQIRLFVSVDSAATWGYGRLVHNDVTMNAPSVCAGGAGYMYLTWVDNFTYPWVGRYTNNLVDPEYVFSNPDRVLGESIYHQSVAAARTAPGYNQEAWILNDHRHTRTYCDLHVSLSRDGGEHWTSSPWPPTNSTGRTEWDMHGASLRYPYNYSVPLCVASATLGGSFDSLITAYSMVSSPDTWLVRSIDNDHRSTRAFPSAIDATEGTGGRAVCYRETGTGNVWFDWVNNAGLADRPEPASVGSRTSMSVLPNPAVGKATVRYALPASGPVELAVFDVTGRQVAELASGTMGAGNHSVNWNSATVEPGVYLLRLDAAGRSTGYRFVVAR